MCIRAYARDTYALIFIFLWLRFGRIERNHYLCTIKVKLINYNGMTNMESNKGEIIMYQPNETIRLEVRVEDETVWLNQQQMADLFGTKRQAITKHLQNIYDSNELKKESTSSILELVRKEGNRIVKRKVEFYNLDVIISVGFRVNTKRGIEFRQWANSVLKQYLLVLVDNYINVDTLTMLSNRETDVSATIYTRQLNQQQRLDVQRHNLQYSPIAINICRHNHDRFLMIDDVVYLFGASLKDAGKKLFAYIKMQETSAKEILKWMR